MDIQDSPPMNSTVPTELTMQSQYTANTAKCEELLGGCEKRNELLPQLIEQLSTSKDVKAYRRVFDYVHGEYSHCQKDLKEAAKLLAENRLGENAEVEKRATEKAAAVEAQCEAKLQAEKKVYHEELERIKKNMLEGISKRRLELEESYQKKNEALTNSTEALGASFKVKEDELAKHKEELKASFENKEGELAQRKSELESLYASKETELNKLYKERDALAKSEEKRRDQKFDQREQTAIVLEADAETRMQDLQNQEEELKTKEQHLHRERAEFQKQVKAQNMTKDELNRKAKATTDQLDARAKALNQERSDFEKLETERENALQQKRTDFEKLKTEQAKALQQERTDFEKLKTEQENALQQERTDFEKLKTEQAKALQQERTDFDKLKTEQAKALKQEQSDFEKLKAQQEDVFNATKTTFLNDSLETLDCAKDNFNIGLGNGLAALANRVPDLGSIEAWITNGAQTFASNQTRIISARFDRAIRQSNGSVRLWTDNTRLLERTSQLEERIITLESRNTALELDKATLEERNSDQARRLGLVEGEKQALEKRATLLEGQVKNLTKVEGQNTLLSEQLTKAQERVAIIEGQNQTLEQCKTDLERQYSSLQGHVKGLDGQTKTLSDDKQALRKQVDLLESQNKTLSDDKQALQTRADLLEGHRKSLSDDKEALQKDITHLQGQLGHLEDTTKLIDSLKQGCFAVNELKKRFEEDKAQLQKDNNAAKTKIGGLEDQVNVLKEENTTLKQRVESLNTEHKSLCQAKLTLVSEKQRLQGSVDVHEKINDKLQTKFDQLAGENKTLKTLLTEWQEKNDEVLRQKTLITRDLEQVKRHLTDAQAAAQLQTGETIELQKEVRALTDSVRDFKDEAEAAKRASSKSKTELSNVTGELQQANEKVAKLEIQYECARDFAAALDDVKKSLERPKVLLPATPVVSLPSTSRKRPREVSPDRLEGRGAPDNTAVVVQQILGDLKEMGASWDYNELTLAGLMEHLSILWNDHEARAHWQDFLRSGDQGCYCFYNLVRFGHGPASKCEKYVKCSSRDNQNRPCLHFDIGGTAPKRKTGFNIPKMDQNYYEWSD